MTTPKRTPDLTILCSRRANTVTARVFGGVLVPTMPTPEHVELGGLLDPRLSAPLDLRDLRDESTPRASWLVRGVRCRCGEVHGPWAVEALLKLRGKAWTVDLDPPATGSRDW